MVGTEEIDVKEFCANGDAAVIRTGANVGTGVISVLTIGIYTPRKVYVTCAAQSPARTARQLELQLDAQGKPVSGLVAEGSERTPVAIESTGTRAWRMSRGSQS